MKTIAVLGYGGRGRMYSHLSKAQLGKLRVVAVCDINPEKLEIAKNEMNLGDDACFVDMEKFFAKGKIADYLFICTQDNQHYDHTTRALRLGYDILLEKPIAPTLQECIDLEQLALETKRKVYVCHVLRYSNFYSQIKEIMDSGKLGKIISIEQIENVGYWHQAHSFVRGNWRKKEDSTPMIMAKCCHDLDLAVWLADSNCVNVTSIGDLTYFNQKNAPADSADRCVDCKYIDSCVYSAKKIYVDTIKKIPRKFAENSWPHCILASDGKATLAKMEDAIKTGPYGRCVYKCDNDVVDFQSTQMLFENGIYSTLTMTAFSQEINRTIKVRGTIAELEGNLNKNQIFIHNFGGKSVKVKKAGFGGMSGHGGGDNNMIKSLASDTLRSDISQSIMSHKIALYAEESRLSNGKCIEIK